MTLWRCVAVIVLVSILAAAVGLAWREIMPPTPEIAIRHLT